MTDDQIEDIQDQLQKDWYEFSESHDWNSETTVINPKCDDCTRCIVCCEESPKTCVYEVIIDGARVGYKVTDGGFLYPALKNVCEKYNLNHPTFEERFKKALREVDSIVIDDTGYDLGLHECNGVIRSNTIYFAQDHTNELRDEFVIEMIGGFSLRKRNK